ncbi:PREDICTED: rho guanine nucleotide exchange factor 6-like isoform X1 [Acropora digitifera]|uniref:rho guanine nucleotide exchange factor 6-like isoform X1 n=1 Tax=Acropora digitifera TaxID=70779 RepID=UPI00077A6FA6|nr:PREDICTED: rho guanine nucleotide exchange factor 6-like isoform X1 [Acropora digitifera]
MGLKPRQIVSWFVALGLLEQHQDTNDLELDSFLLDILKDGSLLCRLLNRLKPSTINKIYQERVTEEQRADNITSFLRACQELQLKDDEIFCPTDLDSPESFPRVLQTLDSLENVATGLCNILIETCSDKKSSSYKSIKTQPNQINFAKLSPT